MNPLDLSRIQFGDTAAFHILWPLMSIGFALYMFVMEALWLYTGNESYYRQARFWTKIFILTFAIGVASGFPLAFQFGTNWAAFATAAGSFFGNIMGFETTVAFTLETASLGILVFGWKRVPKLVHLLSNFGVALGASLSAFWIMVANSWMQMPEGIHMQNGLIIVDNYTAAIFNPDSLVSFGHMWVACIESTLFLIAGISALAIIKNIPDRAFFLNAFKYCLIIAIVITPLQMVLGDMSGRVVAAYQPEKLAAMELVWNTNPLGTGAPFAVVAWPAQGGGANAVSLDVPNALSLLTTHSSVGTVQGLNSFPADDRPSVADSIFIFYAFRLMVLIGVALTGLMLLGIWYWYRGWLAVETIAQHKKFLTLWIYAIPLGFIATEAGWMVREIGRQPWIMYHLMRTSSGLSSNLESPVTLLVIVAITAIYLTLLYLFIYFTRRIVLNGPDLTSPLP
ncbi:MAG TPA: cytochrome ubiquinol oxidase subunit I [Candidatus Paceibacterota bacterium]|nr:cytochrome ubiquinol oxidase subunit I [Candidatus Paceibacterota bacterium]